MSDAPPDPAFSVATPELVAFRYTVAGIGSRFVAQAIDDLVIVAIELAVVVASILLGALGAQTAAILFLVLVSFLVLMGYFLVSEAVWSGQTLGKKAMHLRAVADGGQPLTLGQAVVRNLVRIVDFLPTAYGVGIVSAFISKQNKRLGDLAAGTVVVRDREWMSLRQLTRSLDSDAAGGWRPAAAASAGAPVHLDPELRRFLAAYASRRRELPVEVRGQLAAAVLPRLQQLLPEVVHRDGPVAALDRLADSQL